MHVRIEAPLSEKRHGDLTAILRTCIHCGFCNATCPTYQLLNDELDGPRGRIYLIKQVLEGTAATRLTQIHLDRCLTCRACETTCPSGVQYGQLLEAGREIVERQSKRPFLERCQRYLMLRCFPYRRRFGALLAILRRLRPLLPHALRTRIPPSVAAAAWPAPRHARKMLILPGCVQASLAPTIDAAAANVLDRLDISLLRVDAGVCCGALPHHLSAAEQAIAMAKRNIDACLPYFEQGITTVISTASGCGVMLKDYGSLLAEDPSYADKAARFAAAVKDIAEVLISEDLAALQIDKTATQQIRVAFHSPCTLQHGQRLGGLAEALLQTLGYQLTTVADAHLCCGSAGVYSLLQPELSDRLRTAKLNALHAEPSDILVTANVGCMLHLQSGSRQKIKHWIELLQ